MQIKIFTLPVFGGEQMEEENNRHFQMAFFQTGCTLSGAARLVLHSMTDAHTRHASSENSKCGLVDLWTFRAAGENKGVSRISVRKTPSFFIMHYALSIIHLPSPPPR